MVVSSATFCANFFFINCWCLTRYILDSFGYYGNTLVNVVQLNVDSVQIIHYNLLEYIDLVLR